MIVTKATAKKEESSEMSRRTTDNDYVFMLEIERMKKDIDEINHTKLPAIDKKIGKMEEKIEKFDARLWAIIILLITGIILPVVVKMFIQ